MNKMNKEVLYLECKECRLRFYLFVRFETNKLRIDEWIREHLHKKDIFESNHIHLVYDLSEVSSKRVKWNE